MKEHVLVREFLLSSGNSMFVEKVFDIREVNVRKRTRLS